MAFYALCLILVPWLKVDVQFAEVCCEAILTILLNRSTVLALRKAHIEQSQQVCHHRPYFHHSQLLADAVVRASAERHECALVDDCLRLLLGPTLRHESQRFLEVARVALEAVDWHPYNDVSGNISAVGEGETFWWCFALDT